LLTWAKGDARSFLRYRTNAVQVSATLHQIGTELVEEVLASEAGSPKIILDLRDVRLVDEDCTRL
jgi:anti-anti-sigma regulatory factor